MGYVKNLWLMLWTNFPSALGRTLVLSRLGLEYLGTERDWGVQNSEEISLQETRKKIMTG